MNPVTGRRFLVYCPVHGGLSCPELFGPDRLYDVALNEYQLEDNRSYHPTWHPLTEAADAAALHRFDPLQAEWLFAEHTYPSWALHRNLAKITPSYDYYCFADDDVQVTTQQLNALFLLGEPHRLQLYQPALSTDSHCSHGKLRQRQGSFIRPIDFVEPMIPFFSRQALDICRDTLLESRSGWGLDYVWAKLLNYQQMAVIDGIPVKHIRPGRTGKMRFPDGPTRPQDELRVLRQKYRF